MTTHKHGLMRVFWPSDAPTNDIPGVLIGWRNSELDILVVGVLQGVDVSVRTHGRESSLYIRRHATLSTHCVFDLSSVAVLTRSIISWTDAAKSPSKSWGL